MPPNYKSLKLVACSLQHMPVSLSLSGLSLHSLLRPHVCDMVHPSIPLCSIIAIKSQRGCKLSTPRCHICEVSYLHGVHCNVNASPQQCLVNLFREQTLATNISQRLPQDLVTCYTNRPQISVVRVCCYKTNDLASAGVRERQN